MSFIRVNDVNEGRLRSWSTAENLQHQFASENFGKPESLRYRSSTTENLRYLPKSSTENLHQPFYYYRRPSSNAEILRLTPTRASMSKADNLRFIPVRTSMSEKHRARYISRSPNPENLQLLPREGDSGEGSSRMSTEDTTSLDIKNWKRENIADIFYRAVQKNNVTRAMRSLEEGANLEQRYTQNEHTVLHEASLRGYVHMTEYLCSVGANPNVIDNRRFLPIHYACQFGHTDVVRTLLSYGSSVLEHNEYGDPPLHTTARYNKISLLPYLLAPPNYRTLWVERRKKRLSNALEYEEERRLAEARLRRSKSKKDDQDWMSRFRIFDKKEKMREQDQRPRTVHSVSDDERVVDDVEEHDEGEEEQIEHVNLQNSNGDTALHIAVALGRKRMVKKLLMFGGSAFIRNHQGRTAYDIAQENRDWTIARIIRKNAGLPYPKYWLTPPPDPPKSPVIFLPLEHHGGVREHQPEMSEYDTDSEVRADEADDFVLRRLDINDNNDPKNIIRRKPNQFQTRSYLEPIRPRESSVKIQNNSFDVTDSSSKTRKTEQEKNVEPKSNVPIPPPPPPLPRTSSLSYLAENNNNIKKRNLTFNLEKNLEQEIERTENHHGSSGSCYHHFHVDEPTKTIELEPQPNNVNKVKWKSHSTVEKMSTVNHESFENESTSSVKPQEPVAQTVIPDFPVKSGCFHSCRHCVPNHPPLSEYDSKLMRPSALNVQLGDITDRYQRIDHLSRSVGHQLHELNSIFPSNLRRRTSKRESKRKSKISKKTVSSKRSSSPKKKKEEKEPEKAKTTSKKKPSLFKNKVLLLKCKKISGSGGKSDKCTNTCCDRGTNTSAVEVEEQDELEDGDEIPLTSKKPSKKKFSVDSIKGLDDFRTKSFDETWVTDEKILVEVHREEDETDAEDENGDGTGSWLSGQATTSQSQTTGQSKSKSDYADYPGSDTSSTDSQDLLIDEYPVPYGNSASYGNLAYHTGGHEHYFCKSSDHNYRGQCGLESYQQERNYRIREGQTMQQERENYNRSSGIQPYYPVIHEPVNTGSTQHPYYPVIEEPVISAGVKNNAANVPQANPRSNVQQVNPDRKNDLEAYLRGSRSTAAAASTGADSELRRSEERQDNFHYYTSWGRYDRNSSVSRIGRVGPKIRELQDLLRKAQNKPPLP